MIDRRIVAAFLVVVAAACGSWVARAEAQGISYVNVPPPDTFLALKMYPARHSPRVMAMANGTQLDVLLRRRDGWWFVKVAATGEQGWAFSGRGNQAYIMCCAGSAAATTTAPAPDPNAATGGSGAPTQDSGTSGPAVTSGPAATSGPVADSSATTADPAPAPADANAPVATTDGQPAGGDISSFTCEQLWFARNSIYKEAGYCFKTPRAIAAFKNDGCQIQDANQVHLTPENQTYADSIVRQEQAKACPR